MQKIGLKIIYNTLACLLTILLLDYDRGELYKIQVMQNLDG